ncbi:glycosyltransferase family 4 protein [Erwinia sp. AnSW2-5]|uniref:glycosyltransferase family 4 protein n=1 Tax=Erwinia sp. AnSW2-5 TaxID=3367692 RepID=UPI00385C6349
MKKLHIINLGKMGGVETLFLQYIKENPNEKIICIGNKVGEEIQRQMPQQKITFANRIFNKISLRCPQFLRKNLLQWKIKCADADVIIIWDFIPGISIKPKRSKLLYYDHGCSWRYTKNKKTLNFFSMLDGVICVSHASKRVMELRFNLKCPSNVVINRIKRPEGISSAQKAPSVPLRIGTASRLVTLKGISVMLLTIQELTRRGHNVILEIAGKGPDQNLFENLTKYLNLENKVVFSGFQHSMTDFYNRTDIYLSTPITEPFGLSSMEALYFGIPVIFPLIDGQPEAVKDGYCGIGIIPNMSVKDHQKLTNININFPHDIYDPVSDMLTTPKVISHITCADAVERMMLPEVYSEMSKNAQRYTVENLDYQFFKVEFENVLNSYCK